MADVSVNTGLTTAHARGLRSLVFTTDQIGYCFFITSVDSVSIRKTTDGGATWGSLLGIGLGGPIIAFDVWYDGWTPGTTGTLIWVTWFEATNDKVFGIALNTATDTTSATRTIFTGASAVAGRGAFVSIAKARSGYLYCAYDLDAGAERGLHRSTDGGVNWSANLSTTFVEATLDTCALFPASGTGDDNDCWALYYDASALALTLKLWDSSAVAATESATIGVAHTDGATDLTGQFGYSGAVRHSDGHLIVAALSGRDVAASTHQVFDIASTASITTLTAIAASTDDHYYPQVFIDQTTNAIYVAYNGKRDGTETLDTTSKVYYTKSTDGGTSWSAGDTAYMEGAAAVVQQVWTPLSGLRFYAVWRVGTTLVGNAVNSVSTPSGPAAQAVGGVTLSSGAVVRVPTVAPDAVTVTGATLAVGSSVNPPTVAFPSVDQAVTSATLTTGAAVTPPSVSPGAVTVTGATRTSGSAVTAPTVTTGAVTVTGATVTSSAQVRVPTITTGAVMVTGATLASSAQVFAPTVTAGAVTITGATRATTAQVFAPTVGTAAVTVTGATVTSGLQVFAPTVTTAGVGAVGGATIAAGSVLFSPAVALVPSVAVTDTPFMWLV